jgi:hypothetical protein
MRWRQENGSSARVSRVDKRMRVCVCVSRFPLLSLSSLSPYLMPPIRIRRTLYSSTRIRIILYLYNFNTYNRYLLVFLKISYIDILCNILLLLLFSGRNEKF